MPPKKQPRSGRYTAIETLCCLYRSRKPVNPIFDRLVGKYQLPANERNLAMQLVYGVLRHRQYLDRILAILSRTPLGKLDPFVHQAISVGLYQLFFLERIPESAAVNEAVESCKAAGVPQRLHGFVNGILRQSIRQKGDLATRAATDVKGAPVLNHPEWLVKRWRHTFGEEETKRICRANSCEPALILRVNSAKIDKNDFCRLLDQADISYRNGSYAEEAIRLIDFHGSISNIPGYEEGFFQIQDEAAQLATLLLGPFIKGGSYLDGCAGLGGKTSHLLQLAKQYELQIQAVEPEKQRLKKLTENLERLFPGQDCSIHTDTLQQFASRHDQLFDGVLIDAPCSGTGVTGRHPDIRWNRQPEELLKYHHEQLQLLFLAAGLVSPGGRLVYATCSLELEENRQVIDRFLQSHPDYTLTDCSPLLPEPARILVENGCFVPHPSATIDGFFAARMQRT